MASDAVLADLRASLEAERAALRQQLADLGVDGSREMYDSNFADSSQVTAERGEVEALTGTLTERLGEVEHALEKFDAGTFGVCESCGDVIPPDRLEAIPAARFCINCASKR
jgi:DnaK suppressor protein